LRILIINSEYPPIGGGAGNASANLARSLVARGQDVAVITTQFQGLAHEENQQGIHIRRIPALRKNFDRSGPLEQISFIISGCLSIITFVRGWKPEIVVAFFGIPSGVIAWFARMLFGLPYVVSLRGGDVPGFRPYDFAFYHRMVSPLLRWVWYKGGAVVANSSGLQALANEFEPDMPVRVIPNGIDLREYQPAERSWSPPHLLFVGRLVYQKGLDLLISALSELQDIPWKLSIVGDGPQSKPLRTLSGGLGLSERIDFLGWQARDALPGLYQQANLFVFPSRHEGMPNAVLEAMACGLPVIASRIAGNEELVENDRTGVLVKTEDTPSLREALRALLSDKERCQKMGEQGRQRVESTYSWSGVADKYLELLQRIVEQS
jgi:glycosyltransferase involved in cell wall biosynthesis